MVVGDFSSSAIDDGRSDKRTWAVDDASDEQSLMPLSLRASHDRRPPPPSMPQYFVLQLTVAGSSATTAALPCPNTADGRRSPYGGDGDDDSPAESSSLRLAILSCWNTDPAPLTLRLLAADSMAILPSARMALPVFCSHRTHADTHKMHANRAHKNVL